MKLEGVTVVDLSQFLPGPYLTTLMADHGATIYKIEPLGEGDPGRHIGAGFADGSVFFRNMNRGKKSIALDLKDIAQRDQLLDLCDRCDVFVEGFRPGVMARLGLDYATIAERNPGIVYCSISAYGQTGPYAGRPAHDIAVEAMAGIVSCNLGADGQPTIPHVPVGDIAASLLALSAILMALYRRTHTARGDYIDMAMYDAALASVPNVLGPVFAQKRPPDCKNERSWGGAAFYQIYATSDARHVVLGAQELKFARNLLGLLGRKDLIPLCELGPGAHQEPVKAALKEMFLRKTQAEWIEWFRDKDIAFAPVKNLREAFDDPHAHAREMLLTDRFGHEHVGTPIKFALEPGQPQLVVPALGANNAELIGN
jgi:crotonobetainyl-CoA:carnitine CoA-transferase CaiB-like acyl-CoA transferase